MKKMENSITLQQRRGIAEQSIFIDAQPISNGNGSRSRKKIGLQHHYVHNSSGIIIFRIIVIAIIIICLIWGYLLIQITTGMNSSTYNDNGNTNLASPMMMLARPQLNRPVGKSRIGWAIQQKINHLQLQIQPVPLLDVTQMHSPLLIITYKRADYLERTLWKVLENHQAHTLQQQSSNGDASSIRGSEDSNNRHEARRIVGAPIIISQDGSNQEVQKVIETYSQLFEMKLGVPLYRIEHPRSAVVNEPNEWGEVDEWKTSYIQLAAHYGYALEQTFSGSAYNDGMFSKHNRRIPNPPLPQRVIILEEDIEIADDFFSLMNATADLLDSDDTLLAVSAFNDNGKEQLTANPKRLVRSDFFPGLGWMISRNVWDGCTSHPNSGLKKNWAPGGFWDDWLREPEQRRGRQIIRPEVSRTFHFGNVDGASEGQNSNILNQIELEENNIHWEAQDMSHLTVSSFADKYWNRLSKAKLVDSVHEAKYHIAHSDVKIIYEDFEKFRSLALEFDIMSDEKAGVPRTGYEGIVEIRYGRGKYFIFLAPSYITGERSHNFGNKAWRRYTKESMMLELGIKDSPPPAW